MHFLVFLLWNFLTLYNYFLSAFKGPGFVPLEWRPVSIYSVISEQFITRHIIRPNKKMCV